MRWNIGVTIAVVSLSLGVFRVEAAEICRGNFKAGDILYIGDSISLPAWGYSDAVTDALARNGSIVARYAVGGAASSSWRNHFAGARMFTQAYNAKNPQEKLPNNTLCDDRSGRLNPPIPGSNFPTLDTLFNKSSRAIVIELGTNDIGNYCKSILIHGGKAASGSWVLKEVHDLAVLAHNSNPQCFWIEPIHYKSGLYFDFCTDHGKDPAGYEKAIGALKSSIGSSCRLIESSDCPMPSQFDKVGLHPQVGGPQLGACIGRKIEKAIESAPAGENMAVPRPPIQ